MSSQTLAPQVPAVLRNTPPPVPDLPDVEPSGWPDRSSADPQTRDITGLDRSTGSLERSHSMSQTPQDSQQQHRQALNSLLAALAPNNQLRQSQPASSTEPPASSETVQAGESTTGLEGETQAESGFDVPVASTEAFPAVQEATPLPLNSSIELPGVPPPPHSPDMPHDSGAKSFQPTSSNPPPPPLHFAPPQPSMNDRREIEAFAKIEFEDGNYYITTWACELGRDALAFRAALARAEEAKNHPNGRSQSSSGRVSRPSDRIRRAGDSQVQGSVVSEAGGFGGVDDGPVVPSEEKQDENVQHPSHSSQVSASDVVKPQEVLYNPPIVPFDYHRNAEMQAKLDPDYEEPAPVTSEHLPNADTCPLIPIHAMANSTKSEVATHKGISRRHVRIEWDFESECFKMKVLGRNGAFLDGTYVTKGASKRLHSGAKIQISDIQMVFRLPRPKQDASSESSEHEDGILRPACGRSASPISNDAEDGASKSKPRLMLIKKAAAAATVLDPTIGPDGQPLPPRKRGPGRPPKDGIMSTRERKEREKAAKLAQAKVDNGGKTPPPLARLKITKPVAQEETPSAELKPEKRKYTKRRRDGENGDVLPSIEDGEENIGDEVDKPVIKKPRASKSPSPAYPPLESLTEEQLARPSEPYARLIYDILSDIHPKALPLKQIYRALKTKFPFFVYRVDSDGWQSSVRHNLNQEWNKLFEKGEKEGKGFAWKAIPGALQPQAERKRAAQAAVAAKPKPQPQRNQHNAQQHPPPPNWPNGVPFLPPNWPHGPQGPYSPAPPNGLPWPSPGTLVQQHPPGQARPPVPPGQPVGPQQKPQGTPQPIPATGVRPPPQNSPASTPQPPPQNSSQRPALGQQHRPNARPSQPPSFATRASAAPNMPCTLEGVMAIRRFENAMYEQVLKGGNPNLEHWQMVFSSVKNRLLHGATQSSLPEGETKEERTIMSHVKNFIDKFRNPAFVGFGDKGAQSPGVRTPAAGTPVPENRGPGTSVGGAVQKNGEQTMENARSSETDAEVRDSTVDGKANGTLNAQREQGAAPGAVP